MVTYRQNGGTGRRAGFKIQWAKAREGSSPSSATKKNSYAGDARVASRNLRVMPIILAGGLEITHMVQRKRLYE